MITNLIFHTLKGIQGWSHLAINKIDVAKVVDMSYHKRLFMIFNRTHPYTLHITYSEPIERLKPAPVIGGQGGTALVKQVDLTQYITKRYKTLDEAENEIKEIMKKQDQLKNVGKSIIDNIDKLNNLSKLDKF